MVQLLFKQEPRTEDTKNQKINTKNQISKGSPKYGGPSPSDDKILVNANCLNNSLGDQAHFNRKHGQTETVRPVCYANPCASGAGCQTIVA